MPTSGLFISFEGSEGCGKSTQIALLEEALKGRGRDLVRVREPGGTPLGEEIRRLLKHSAAGEGMCPEAEILLFSASRAELTRSVILPSLQAGRVVIADRFVDSTTVYQGVARGLPVAAVTTVNTFATSGRLPDLTILLDLDVATSRSRTDGRGQGRDRFEREDDVFFAKVRQGYLELAAAEPERFLVIDANLSPEEIHRLVMERVDGQLTGHRTGA
ncbi:MAG: dTMP kinase [Verrucomicrobiales bacterium]